MNWLRKVFPVSSFVVEDIKAESKKGQRRWNRSFNSVQRGKNWFYTQLSKFGGVWLLEGLETAELRAKYGLKKSYKKLSSVFEAHCVDSWVLANSLVGGHTKPDNKQMLLITPFRFRRRSLHYLQPKKGGVRGLHGGTISLGLKRGSLVRHKKRGLAYVGGTMDGELSLHSLETGLRLGQHFRLDECQFLSYNSWRVR